MQIIERAITGNEISEGEGSPYSILVDFYRAFNCQDIERMASNWLHSEDASMSNPLGGIKRGWEEIKKVYEKIFFGEARVYVEFYEYLIHEGDGMFVAVGREKGTLTVNHTTLELAIRTSRIYCNEQGRWKQLHHHGSMDDADLLIKYQSTLTGNETGKML